METTEHDLNCKITELTLLIKDKYPELYITLSENTETFDCDEDPGVSTAKLQEYYDSLRHILNNYITEHGKSDLQE